MMHLAIDIGASGGRHILGWLEKGNLRLTEVYRFANGPIRKNGRLCWDVERLLEHIVEGMKKCRELGKIPRSVGIDTWGVDYALLDGAGQRLGEAVCYRDERTQGMAALVHARIAEEELYRRTGVAAQSINTIYQLAAAHRAGALDDARGLLLTPDYLHYRLCGVARAEYTMATTTGLLGARTRDWDEHILKACGFARELFPKVAMPGERLGALLPEIQAQVGFNCDVVLPPTHDTAAAIAAIPQDEDSLFISSGTWSLMGMEREAPDTSPESWAAGFTNEGGFGGICYLKNIPGLWFVQCLKKELDDRYTYADLCAMAECSPIASRIDCADARFTAPESMIREIQAACAERGDAVPTSPGELAAVIYQSLAETYRQTKAQIETLVGKRFSRIVIVGGGSNATYLNELTEKATGARVSAGLPEATSVGNLLVQMIACGVFDSLRAARTCVRATFGVG